MRVDSFVVGGRERHDPVRDWPSHKRCGWEELLLASPRKDGKKSSCLPVFSVFDEMMQASDAASAAAQAEIFSEVQVMFK